MFFAIGPFTLLSITIWKLHATPTVGVFVFPLANEPCSVWISVGPLSMPLIVLKFTLIRVTVGPSVGTLTIHLVVSPVSFIYEAVGTNDSAIPLPDPSLARP